MKNLYLPFIVIPLFTACSSDSIEKPLLADLGYTAAGTFGTCLNEGRIVDFTLDFETSEATIGLAMHKDDCPDLDLTKCFIRTELKIQADETQIATLLRLAREVPDPMCTSEPGACTICLIETLSVDGRAVSTDCCGSMVADFEPKLAAFVAYLEVLASPEEQPLPAGKAFRNPESFTTLRYLAGGTCESIGMLVNATITRSANQSLSMSGFLLADITLKNCYEEAGKCYTGFGPIDLNQDQKSTLESALAAMPAPACVEDPSLACDEPCLLHSIRMDGDFVDDACCGTMTPEYINGLAAIIESINTIP
jgi:hypothetical protein